MLTGQTDPSSSTAGVGGCGGGLRVRLEREEGDGGAVALANVIISASEFGTDDDNQEDQAFPSVDALLGP
jgi:hypothetical protein